MSGFWQIFWSGSAWCNYQSLIF